MIQFMNRVVMIHNLCEQSILWSFTLLHRKVCTLQSLQSKMRWNLLSDDDSDDDSWGMWSVSMGIACKRKPEQERRL